MTVNVFLHKLPILYRILHVIYIVSSVRFVTQTAYTLLLPNIFLCAINYCVIDYFELSFSQL